MNNFNQLIDDFLVNNILYKRRFIGNIKKPISKSNQTKIVCTDIDRDYYIPLLRELFIKDGIKVLIEDVDFFFYIRYRNKEGVSDKFIKLHTLTFKPEGCLLYVCEYYGVIEDRDSFSYKGFDYKTLDVSRIETMRLGDTEWSGNPDIANNLLNLVFSISQFMEIKNLINGRSDYLYDKWKLELTLLHYFLHDNRDYNKLLIEFFENILKEQTSDYLLTDIVTYLEISEKSMKGSLKSLINHKLYTDEYKFFLIKYLKEYCSKEKLNILEKEIEKYKNK